MSPFYLLKSAPYLLRLYSDFVFLDDKGGLFHYKKLNHRLDRISAAIDNEIKSKGTVNGLSPFPHVHNHMLRHTFATRMREAGDVTSKLKPKFKPIYTV